MKRLALLSILALSLPLAAEPGGAEASSVPAFDWPSLEKGWRDRIGSIRATGRVPMVDVLSNYTEWALGAEALKAKMDEAGVALIALSPENLDPADDRSEYFNWQSSLQRLMAAAPSCFIPVPMADLRGVVMRGENPSAFLDQLLAAVLRHRYPLLGEFRFWSYPSNQRWLRGVTKTPEVAVAIDGPIGERLFKFSQEHGLPFLIHYEPEDGLLPPLEKMLARYPGAKVVWRHAGQIRYKDRSTIYGPAYVRKLLETYPNLYFDLSRTRIDEFYLPSRQFSSTLWDRRSRTLDRRWVSVISEHPWRFLAGFGLTSDMTFLLSREAAASSALLTQLPREARDIVAYRAAWKLLFRGELP